MLRFLLALIVIATFVLIAAYLVTKNQKYIDALKKLLLYSAWAGVLLILFSIVARLIRL